MFVGHYGVSFAAKRVAPGIPLWVLFLAVQLLDVFWAPLVLLGIEKVRVVPGITASNPLDLYYMPYTHSLLAAILWSGGALLVYRLLSEPDPAGRAAAVLALAVFSHWLLPRLRMIVFGLAMLAIQAYIFFGPPPMSDNAVAWTALASYAAFAGVVARLERPGRASGYRAA